MSAWFDDFGFSLVLPNFLIGAYPLDADDVRQLSELGIRRIHNLCEDVEYRDGMRPQVVAALEKAGIEERREPLMDYGNLAAEELERTVADVRESLHEGKRVYLHCRAGWQRSAAVAAGVVALERDLDIQEALRHVQSARSRGIPLEHQIEDLVAWWSQREG